MKEPNIFSILIEKESDTKNLIGCVSLQINDYFFDYLINKKLYFNDDSIKLNFSL